MSGHAHDGHPRGLLPWARRRTRGDALPDRILVRKVLSGERVVDNAHPLRILIVVLGEVAALEEPHSHGTHRVRCDPRNIRRRILSWRWKRASRDSVARLPSAKER